MTHTRFLIYILLIHREWKSKHEIDDNKADDTVTFFARDLFVFRPDLSGPGLTGTEVLTIIDPLITSAALVVKRERAALLPLVAKAVDIVFPQKIPFHTGPAMDILFDGYWVDCSSQEMPVKALCGALETEASGIKRYNETHLKFSLFQAVWFE